MPVGIAPYSASSSGLVVAMIGLHRAVDEARELVGVFDLLVVDELEFRRVPQLQRASELAAQESRGAIQPFADLFRRVLVAEGHEPDARGRHVGRDTAPR